MREEWRHSCALLIGWMEWEWAGMRRLDPWQRRIADLKTSQRGHWKEDFSRPWWRGCKIGAELQIVWSCLSRTSRCRVLSAALCPGECFPVRTAGLLRKPPYAVKESGWVVGIEDKGEVWSEPVQSDLSVLMSLIILPPSTPGEMFSVQIAFFLQPSRPPSLLIWFYALLCFPYRFSAI